MESPIYSPTGDELIKRVRERTAAVFGEYESEIHRLQVEIERREVEIRRLERQSNERTVLATERGEKVAALEAEVKRLGADNDRLTHDGIDAERLIEERAFLVEKMAEIRVDLARRRGFPFKAIALAGTLGWFLGWLMSH